MSRRFRLQSNKKFSLLETFKSQKKKIPNSINLLNWNLEFELLKFIIKRFEL